MRELIERSSDTEGSLLICIETDLAKYVTKLCPDVRRCTMVTSDLGIPVKGTLYHDGKFYDIEDYAKLYVKLDDQAIERGQYKRWTKERVVGAQKIWDRVVQKIVEDFEAGRLNEWADSWIMYEKGPLIG